jgi:hypothetical protein
VHRSDCPNILKVDAERRMAVDWSQERTSAYPAALQIECLDRIGIANDILKKVTENKINLQNLRVETHKEKKTATINLILDVLDINQLTKVSQSISQISDVLRVQRKDHRKRGMAPQGKSGTESDTEPESPNNVTPLQSGSRKKRPIRKQAHLGE